MNLSELIADCNVVPAPRRGAGTPLSDIEITHVTDDSRQVTPGSLFIARRGVKEDGRRWIADAVAFHARAILTDEAGAEAAMSAIAGAERPPALLQTSLDLRTVTATLAERFHGRPGSRLRLVGVTGSNGKTTIAWLVRQLAAGAGIPCGLISTVETIAGGEHKPAQMTTPPAPEISALLARMVEAGDTACAMEVSSHALDQSRTGALRFDAAVFTNLTGDHLDYHGDMAAYADAKARLFAALDPGALAVVNADDPAHTRMLHGANATVCRCSEKEGDAVVTLGASTLDGCALTLTGAWGMIETTVPLLGAHNAMNTLQAVVCAHRLGATRAQLESALPRLVPPPGRLERVAGPAGFPSPAVVVDYAHSDDALEKTCRTLRELLPDGGKLRLVFGCGGDRDTTKRPRMGAVAAALADVCYVTSDNPRTEPPRGIIDMILDGMPGQTRSDPGRCVPIVQRREAIAVALRDADERDIVCIAGKGHERVQIMPDGRGGTIKLPFHDPTVARRELEELAQVIEP
ncbi:MAG: UDP-N-acetylmuramoyl-L-alanyl-D-glutamate--2,6-diaminopimelate ligase [Phycisphaeraceae bacterium]|nr:UDP-N-acetylmuramoyl-L-alanyl-D-glutamate--2,6-diaminopimelate ligase [Phycisphaeraceae bacterium]